MAVLLQPPQFACGHGTTDSDAALLALSGELDLSTVGELQRSFETVVDGGSTSIVVDLGELTFIDSSGLAALLTFAARARSGELTLEFVPGSTGVMRVFEMTRTVDVLPFRWAA